LTVYLFSMAKYPTTYSFYTCIVTIVLLLPAFFVMPSLWGMPSKEMFLGPHYFLTLIVLFTTFDLAFTNIALANLSTALQQCIAATQPFWTIFIETLIHRRVQHPLVYGAVIGLVVGAALASVSDVKNVNYFGVVSAVMAVLCSASKGAFTHAAFKKYRGQLTPLALLFWVDLLMVPIYMPWVLINGELMEIILRSSMSASEWQQFTGTAALNGTRALTQYFVLRLVTATSLSTTNVCTMALNILISMIWQHVEMTALLAAGISMVLFFSALYTYLLSSRNACWGLMQDPECNVTLCMCFNEAQQSAPSTKRAASTLLAKE